MRRLLPLFLAALAAAGCTVANPHPAAPQPSPSAAPIAIDWQPVTLPVPAGGGRAAPRDVVNCGGTWYVVGAVVAADGGLSPAVWASRDGGTSFGSVPMDAHTFYGRQNLLYTVGCRDGKIATVGAKSGGAHGNPRVATWYQRPDGSLTEVEAYFELYGGGDHVGVSHIAGRSAGAGDSAGAGNSAGGTAGAGDSAGWLIAGNRVSGAAVWVSTDATSFELIEYGGGHVSGITGGTASPQPSAGTSPPPSAGATAAADVVATPDGWTVVGSVLRPGRVGRDAAAWTSTDGRRFEPAEVPSVDQDDALIRVAAVDGGLLGVGVRGDAFGAWSWRGGRWTATGSFGRSRGQIAAGVGGIATFGQRVLVATEAASGRQLWFCDPAGGAFAPATAPAAVPAGGDTALTVGGAGGVVLLVADDGRVGGVWRASQP